ncbi:transcription factor 21 [Hippocampus comes]|uniref:transcription factor 21 n=1 Tax=Hippocampus comes TaxID=109280 RepID=UPI00094F34B5|nr:PREDICTED: transcription factor 21 [Hippocampus comes]
MLSATHEHTQAAPGSPRSEAGLRTPPAPAPPLPAMSTGSPSEADDELLLDGILKLASAESAEESSNGEGRAAARLTPAKRRRTASRKAAARKASAGEEEGDGGGGAPREGKQVQRNAANARERARMRVLSKAFSRLKTSLPWVPADTKLSKLDTLRLASSYIAHLRQVLANDKYESGYIHPVNLTWPFMGAGKPDNELKEMLSSTRLCGTTAS